MAFHVTENGPKQCNAKHGGCPYSSQENSHFDTSEKAQKEYESRMPSLFTVSKRADDSDNNARTVTSENLHDDEASVYEHGEVVPVEDNWGDSMEVQAGVWNEDSEWLFQNGQCLAMATELSKHLGNDKLFTIYYEEEGELVWDDDNDEPLLDEDGEEQYETTRIPHHVMAMDSEGNVWDSLGRIAVESLTLDDEHKTVTNTVDDTRDLFEGFLSTQDYNFARSFSGSVIKDRAGRN